MTDTSFSAATRRQLLTLAAVGGAGVLSAPRRAPTTATTPATDTATGTGRPPA
ncbi:hypothetical protein G7075_09910 [Phycicoccus sp. HDW14]|uniref:hypothetical protein n=1 Tax=Phycicoccus sp. HDW14 TaxID=2714941 RepID=UPI00140B0C67|nr:hypothetical protein [Phycicoccus sp. HDW14]QIM21367.1 hypothetical protein G7075_09910 [Phycicoccus sp. HDW14]